MKTIEIMDHDDTWAEVELYRWQHGHLPGEAGQPEHPLDIVAGLRGMAAAIEKGDEKNFPAPMNVMEVLRYCARRLAKRQKDLADAPVEDYKQCPHCCGILE